MDIHLNNVEQMITNCLKLDVSLFQVDAHSDACPTCQPFQGKVFSFEGRDRNWPVLEKVPPFCLHCRHVLVPYIPRDKTEERRLQKFSNLSGIFIYDWFDYKRVLEGGKPHTTPNEDWANSKYWKKRLQDQGE